MNIIKYKNRLYGRVRGRSKKNISTKSYLKILEKYKLFNFDKDKSYILDIGTGFGETSIFLAKKFKDFTIIACEKYIDGNLSLINNLKKENIYNIKIHPGNVHDLLDTIDIEEYFKNVWIFFPDPWPKKKHHKRRLITHAFLEKLYPFVNKDGEICIITDIHSYTRFILNNMHLSKNKYEWKNQAKFYLGLKDYYDIDTKFYKKAIISGRKPSLFILKKI